MERKNYTVAVDLGSSTVVVAVGTKTPEGLMEVACVVTKPVEGVHAGRIENIELVSRAIRDAVSEAEQQLGIRITEAYAGISGDFVRCARHTDHVFVYDPQNGVNQKDVDALFDRMRNVQAPDDETIMERVPQNYLVDDNQEVRNPVGSFGKKLSSTFNFILCQKTPMQRLGMALKRLGIRMVDVVSDAMAIPESILLPDEKEEGVAVVDVGAEVTDVTVYYRNVVRYIASIPMGASAINRDIRTMSVPEKYVESLKQKYGSAVADLAPEDKLIRVNGRTAREAKDILLRNLATVIEARATDIVEFVQQELKDSGYAGKLAYGIVLTGGSAKLKDFDELFRRVTGLDVRIAVPETGLTEDSKEKVADPAYTTAVGILLHGAELGGCAVVERPSTAPSVSPSEPRQPYAPQTGGTEPSRPGGRSPQMPQPSSQTSQTSGTSQQPQTPFGRPYTSPYTSATGPVNPATPAESTGTVSPNVPPTPSVPVTSGPKTSVSDSGELDDPEDDPHQEGSRGRRDFGSFIKSVFGKIDKSFKSVEDEEI